MAVKVIHLRVISPYKDKESIKVVFMIRGLQIYINEQPIRYVSPNEPHLDFLLSGYRTELSKATDDLSKRRAYYKVYLGSILEILIDHQSVLWKIFQEMYDVYILFMECIIHLELKNKSLPAMTEILYDAKFLRNKGTKFNISVDTLRNIRHPRNELELVNLFAGLFR